MAAESLSRLRAAWSARSARERTLLAIGAAVVLIGLAYGLVYQPVGRARAALAGRLPALRADLRLMRSQVAQIERLRRLSPQSGAGGGSLTRSVESTAAARGLRDSITTLPPLGGDRLQLVGKPVPAKLWLDWLSDLNRAGIRVQSCHLSLSSAGSLVGIDAILTGGRP